MALKTQADLNRELAIREMEIRDNSQRPSHIPYGLKTQADLNRELAIREMEIRDKYGFSHSNGRRK